MSNRFCFALLAAGALAWGQDPGLRGPASGLVFDAPSQSVRIINGIPGAAYLGPAVVSGVSAASLSPDGQAALVQKEDGWFLVTGLNSAEPLWTPAAGLVAAPRLISWSADGQAAAWTGQSGEAVHLFKTSSVSETVLPVQDLAGRITALAAAPGGEAVYAAVLDDERGGSIYRAGTDGAWVLLASTKGAAALALASSGTLYAADTANGDLLRIQPALEAGTETLGSLSAGAPAVALQISRDGRRLLAARGGEEPRIEVFDIASREFSEPVALDSAPASLERIAGGSHLLLNSRSQNGDVIMILTEGPGAFRAFFVPAGE